MFMRLPRMATLPAILLTTTLLIATLLITGAKIARADPPAGHLAELRSRGVFKCGVYENVPGLALLDAAGHWSGLDVDTCRAMAAALLGDAGHVEFVKMTFAQGIPAVQAGDVDMAGLAIAATVQRLTEFGLDIIGPTLYSGLGFMVNRRSGAAKLADLNGLPVCFLGGGTTESQIAAYFQPRGLTFIPVAIEAPALLFTAYEDGRCDVVTMEPPFLAIRRARLAKPADHIILPDLFTRSDMGPVIRDDDVAFSKAARTVLWALVTAEELGITAANVDQLAATAKDPAIRRFLGLDGDIGTKAGLPSNTFTQVLIKAVGNYGEIWDRNYGRPFGLDRGPNRLVRDGGQQWAPLWR